MNKKYKIFVYILAVALILLGGFASKLEAQSSGNTGSTGSYSPFKLLNGIMSPQGTAWTFRLPYLGGSGTKCVQVDNDGDFSLASDVCGSGGGAGGGIGTTTPWTIGNLVMVSSNGYVTSIATSTLVNQIFPWTSFGAGTSTIFRFGNGLMSFSSTTLNGLKLSDLSQGFLYTGTNGLVQPVASSSIKLSWFNNDANFITLSSLSASYPLSYNSGTGAFTFGGLGTTTTWSPGRIVSVVNGNTLTSYATTTVDCSGSVSCSQFITIGSSPITITGSGGSGGGLGTTSPWTGGSLVTVFSDGNVTSISTSTLVNQIFPFISNGISTTSVFGLQGGFYSTASSTLSGNVYFPALSQGFAYLGSNGKLNTVASTSAGFALDTRTITINGTSNQITSSAGAQDLSANRTWTLSIPSQFNIQQSSSTVTSALTGYFNNIFATSTSATSTIANLAGVIDASTFSGADIGAQVNAAISYASEGSTIIIPAGYRGTQTTKININKHVTLDCQGAKLTWSGAANSTSTVLNAGTDNPYTPSWGIQNCDLKGPDGTTTVGLEVGGTLGAANAVVRGNHIWDFGFGIRTVQNAYLVKFENNFLEYNNRAVHVQSPNNSGENFSWLDNTIADCDTPDKCFYSEVNGMVFANFSGNSVDDAGVWLEDGNSLGGSNNYFENPGWATIGRYNYFVTSPGGYTNVTLIGGKFTNGADNSGQSPNQYILNGGNMTLIGVGTESFNSITVPALVVNYGGDGEQLQMFGIKDYPNSLGVYATSSVAYVLGSKNSGFSAFGTTSPQYRLTSYSATAPQLSLSAGAGISQWTFRNAGGSFYLSTTTSDGTSTSTVHAFAINTNGQPAFPYLKSCDTIDSDANGNLTCGTDASGGSSFSFPFTVNAGYNSTSTVIGFTAGLFSMSTTTLNGTKLSDLSQGWAYIGSNGLVQTVSTTSLASNLFTFNSYGMATNTITNFVNGVFSPASSTFSGPFRLSALSNGGLAVFNGLVSSGATTTAGTGLTYSGNAFNVNTSQNISTLSNLTSNGAVLTSGGTGALSIYTGTSCTNQFVRSLNGSISATCATVANTDLANSSITINGSSVSLGGSITVASTTLLSDLNNWTKRQEFANTTTTLASFNYASSTNLFAGFLTLSTTTAGTLKTSASGLVYVDTSAGGSGYTTIQDEGSGLTARSILNFTGSGVNCVDNSGSSRTDCTINAGAASAGGSDTQVQFNDGGSLGGAVGWIWNKAKTVLGIGTTTPTEIAKVTIATSTAPQLALGNAIAGNPLWTLRTTGNNFYISTTTVAGTSTTTTNAFVMDINGNSVFGGARAEPVSDGSLGLVPTVEFATQKGADMAVLIQNLSSGYAASIGIKTASDYNQFRQYTGTVAWFIGTNGNGDYAFYNDITGKTPFRIDDAATSTALQIEGTNVITNAGVVLGLGGKCAANITSDAPAALSVTSCNTLSLTSDNTTSTSRTFCLDAGTEGQMIRLFADVSGANEIELGDGAAGACAGGTGAATFLAGVWPATTNQNNDVATLIYRTTASGAQANGWYEVARAAN